MSTGPVAAAKADLRMRIRAARARRTDAERTAAGERIRDALLALPQVTDAAVVAAYVDCSNEPSTTALLIALKDRGIRVLLPVQRGDGELDWASYDGHSALATGPHGISEPIGSRLGVDAIATANVVVVPALALSRSGYRLGQGGGFYDRALQRADPTALTIALVYDDELLATVPVDERDRTVRAAATPSGVSWLARGA